MPGSSSTQPRRSTAQETVAQPVEIDRYDEGRCRAASLLRWWAEPKATNVYALAGIRPVGHGIWHHHGRTVRFFLEYDRA
jgi:hypothetical protein